MAAHADRVLVLDYGSQYTRLIARRIRELGVYCEILSWNRAEQVLAEPPAALVLSGGPDSVARPGAPDLDPRLLELGVPVLGICYGMQILVQQLGGHVRPADRREYGSAELDVAVDSVLFGDTPKRQRVWMSHGDRVESLPDGLHSIARTENSDYAAVEDPDRRIVGIQFHPEVVHTEHGARLLRNFLFTMGGLRPTWSMAAFLDEEVERIRARVGSAGRVLCALSGGVDSSVMAMLVHRAIGDRLVCVFVDNGLLRKDEAAEVVHRFRDTYHLDVRLVDATERFLSALSGVEDPEEKRRRIGRTFIEIFEAEARTLGDVRYLAQGTIYPDRIESAAVTGPSASIKTHHNVGGLPERMDLELIEPLGELFKDEVRRLGRELGLPAELVGRHPFPGPGLAVRLLGPVSRDALDTLREADAIYVEELRAAGLYDEVAQAFAVLLPVHTVGVMGDFRTYDRLVALRAVTTEDFMTADWARLPADFLARVANRIVNEVAGVNRVVYDVTSKPPGTIEWE